MSRLSREEFEDRFLGDAIDLSPREIVQEDTGWVIELSSMPFEKTAMKLKEIVERNSGDKPVYLSVGSTMVKVGDITPGVLLINEIYQTLNTLGVRILENNTEVDKMRYLHDAVLPSFTESDYLV